MSAEKHSLAENTAVATPGPWRGRHNGDDPLQGILIEAESDARFTIALVNCPEETVYESDEYKTYTHPDTLFANARLIAAAPDLLDALKRLLNAPSVCTLGATMLARTLAEEAIAKAEGVQ